MTSRRDWTGLDRLSCTGFVSGLEGVSGKEDEEQEEGEEEEEEEVEEDEEEAVLCTLASPVASGQPRDALCHGARAASKTRVGGPAPPKQDEPPKAWAAPKQAALKAWAAPKREREQFSSYSTLPLLVRRLLAVRIHKGSAGYAGRVWHRRQWRQWGSRRLQQLPLASLCTVLVGLASNAVPPLRQLVLVLKTRMRRENLVSRIAGKIPGAGGLLGRSPVPQSLQ